METPAAPSAELKARLLAHQAEHRRLQLAAEREGFLAHREIVTDPDGKLEMEVRAEIAAHLLTALESLKFPPAPPTGEPSAEKPLDEHTIDELRALAAAEGIDLTGRHLKAEILDAIALAKTPLAGRTIAQLADLASGEGIDLSGLKSKADIISAIEAARGKAPAA